MNKALLWICFGLLVFLGITWVGSTYNSFVRLDEQVVANWAQVENQYKRRLDLIPNLVETVKGYAAHEKETLTQVTALRSAAQRAGAAPDLLTNKTAMENYVKAQSALSQGLGRLMVVVERYPDLKANTSFLSLQSQLEGTENRIAVERRNYIETVREYNTRIRVFPSALIASLFDFKKKQTFDMPDEASNPPKVSF